MNSSTALRSARRLGFVLFLLTSVAALTVWAAPDQLEVEFTASEVIVGEGVGVVTLSVRLSKVSENTVTVQYASEDGSATSPDDYTNTSSTLTFEPGETLKEIQIIVIDDSSQEDKEYFYAKLSNPQNASLGAKNEVKIYIIDNDSPPPTVQVNSTAATVSENAGSISVQVSLSAEAPLPVTVNYTTSNGTATGGEDFTITTSAVVFAVGEITKSVSVPIIDDTAPESSETFTVKLTSATGATIGTQDTATITIDDDDASPSISPVTVTATGGTFAPEYSPAGSEVTTTMSAKAVRPSPTPPATISSPTWAWQDVGAQQSDVSETGPWSTGAGYSCTFEPAAAPDPDSTYDYSVVTVTASFPVGGYWIVNCNAQVNYTDSANSAYQGAAIAQGKNIIPMVEIDFKGNTKEAKQSAKAFTVLVNNFPRPDDATKLTHLDDKINGTDDRRRLEKSKLQLKVIGFPVGGVVGIQIDSDHKGKVRIFDDTPAKSRRANRSGRRRWWA